MQWLNEDQGIQLPDLTVNWPSIQIVHTVHS
jgi:hypothetical protein